MKVLGVTGGVGTGKSTVARMFGRRGAVVLDADRIAHELMGPGTAVTRRIRSRFGPGMLTPGGGVDRRRLGRHVFESPNRLKALTGILHPAVRRTIGQRLRQIRRCDPNGVAVLDIPLLFESGHYRPDAVVVVTTPLREAARRLKSRSGWPLKEVKRRSSFQMPLREKVGRADFVVHNGASRKETSRQVERIWNEIVKGERNGRRQDG